MSFAAPLALLGLLVVPLLIAWYRAQQRARVRSARGWVSAPLEPSLAPRSPRWRRHVPMVVFGVALAVLVLAAARPQRSVAVPLSDGAVMLADDVSSSMAATDLAPSRLAAAREAARRFVARVPSTIRVGVMEFNQRPVVLQSPTVNHALAAGALDQLQHANGHTAIGDAINLATTSLTELRSSNGKRPPAAIVLLSDGTSTGGADPLTAARTAAGRHIPVSTVSVGTPRGTIPVRRGDRTVQEPVPVSAGELAQIARVGGGHAYTAADAGGLSAVYAHLAAELGHKHVKREISAGFAGAGLLLLLLGSTLSLGWFGRLV